MKHRHDHRRAESPLAPVPAQRMFTKAEAARYLGISLGKLIQLTDLGEIPCRTFAKRRAYLLEDLNAYIQSLETWTAQEAPPAITNHKETNRT